MPILMGPGMVTMQMLRVVVPQMMPAALTTPPVGCWNVSVYGPPSGSADGSPGVGEPAEVPPELLVVASAGGGAGTAAKLAPHDLVPFSWSW
jgi:hypothetical protein